MVTAGIETDTCAPEWIEGINKMDLTLVSSEHAKSVFENAKYEKKDERTGQTVGVVALNKPVEVLFEGVDLTKYFPMTDSELPEDPAQADQLFADYLLQSLGKIRRRLGADNYSELLTSMEYALSVTATDLTAHRDWIRILLQKYYDPMYEYQLGKKSTRVVFRGSRDELMQWAAHLDKPAPALKASI